MSRTFPCVHRLPLSAALAVMALWGSPAHAQPEGPAPYMRVVEADDGAVLTLEMAIRELRPPEDGRPVVFLTAAVHIADQSFYDALQGFLDAQDLVLYEGVKPAGAGNRGADRALDDEGKVKATRRRLRFLAMVSEGFRSQHGRPPESLEELGAGTEEPLGSLVRASTGDAWGHTIVVEAAGGQFDLVSLGRDGRPGGEGPDRDERFSDQPSLTAGERSQGPGIQQKMADALGLVFQLKAMRHDAPHWRNSDMSVDQVQRRLEDAGVGGGGLLSILDGSSMTARLAGLLLRMISASPTAQALTKLMLVETIARADEVLAAAPGGMSAIMDVLVKDRNQVVIDDLLQVTEEPGDVRTIGVIYGAGHLPDLETRLVAELGYTPGASRWTPAIVVDLEQAGVPASQARQMREMIRRTLDAQLRRARR